MAVLAWTTGAIATPIENANATLTSILFLVSAPTGHVAAEQASTSICTHTSAHCEDDNIIAADVLEYPRGQTSVFVMPAFRSAKFCGGNNANGIAACAQGFSCFGGGVISLIGQDGSRVSADNAGGRSWDKIVIFS